MDNTAQEILALIRCMAHQDRIVEYAQHYFEGPGASASMKERTIRFIDLLIQDGSAMGFDEDDDVGDILWCMDDIAEYYHLMISEHWFSQEDDMSGWLATLGERWARNGVALLCIEDPKGKMYPVYAAASEDVPQILEQASRAGIAIYDVRELRDIDALDDRIDFSEIL